MRTHRFRIATTGWSTVLLIGAVLFANPGAAADPAPYYIGPGDLLEVRVFGRPQLTGDVRVDGSGQIRLPFITEGLRANCRTEEQLASDIARAYHEYLKNPQVTVFIKDYSSQTVTLGGAVNRPGTFQLKRRVRLNELIAVAGGLSTSAGDTIQVVHDPMRSTCTQESTDASAGAETFSIRALLRSNDAANPYLLPGDFLHVSTAQQAYVTGNVHTPTPITLAQPISLTRALAMAGGRLPSSRNDVRILRKRTDGSNGLEVLVFSIRDVERNKQEDPALRAGDIVEVQTSVTKSVAKTILAAFASVGAVYYPLVVLQ